MWDLEIITIVNLLEVAAHTLLCLPVPSDKFHYCKTRQFHMRLIFTSSTDEANPWTLKASKICENVLMG